MIENLRKRNHFIPKMILKNFTHNNNIYQFNLVENAWPSPNGYITDGAMTPEGVGKENYLYIFQDENGKLCDSIEIKFGDIENKVTPIIKKLIQYNSHTFITNVNDIINHAEFECLLHFLTIGYLRTPKKFEELANLIARTNIIIISMKITTEEKIKFLSKFQNFEELEINDFEKIFLQHYKLQIDNQHILEIILKDKLIEKILISLSNYKWFLINNKTANKFLMGDGFINLENKGLDEDNTLYVPLSNQKALLGMNRFDNKDLKLFEERLMQDYHGLIKEFNVSAIQNAKYHIYSAVRSNHIESLINQYYINNPYSIFYERINVSYPIINNNVKN